MKKIRCLIFSIIILSLAGCLEFPEENVVVEGPQYGAGVTDIDGNFYQTVIIGDQEWMAEELKVTHYPDGTVIQLAQSADAWVHPNNKKGVYCISYNDFDEKDTYLYNWYAAVGPDTTLVGASKLQGACPDGWHLPGADQWNTLIDTLNLRVIDYGGIGYFHLNGYLMLFERANWPKQEESYILGLKYLDNCTGFNLEPRSTRYVNAFRDYESVSFWTDSTANMFIFSGACGPFSTTNYAISKDVNGLCIRCIKD